MPHYLFQLYRKAGDVQLVPLEAADDEDARLLAEISLTLTSDLIRCEVFGSGTRLFELDQPAVRTLPAAWLASG